jgi:transcriptional regulator with XRE-family HTH domain
MFRLGKKLKQLRKMKNLTQREFAKIVRITYRHYQTIEADKANIRLSTAEDIATGLMIPVQTLLDQKHGPELVGTGLTDAWQILELFPVGVCVANLEGRIIYLNSFFKTNFLPEPNGIDLENFFVWDLLPLEKKDQGKLDFLKIIREKSKPKPGHRTYLGPGGKQIEVRIFWDYIYDVGKKPKGFLSSIVPI